jgi:hypothetical protein
LFGIAHTHCRPGGPLPLTAIDCRPPGCGNATFQRAGRGIRGPRRTGLAFARPSLQIHIRAAIAGAKPFSSGEHSPEAAREDRMSSIGNLNYDSFLVSGNTNIRKSDQNYLTSQAGALTASKKAEKPGTVQDEFKKYMEMTPAEKIRFGVLNELGITEEQLAALPPEQREAMEKKIADLIALRTGGNDDNSIASQGGPSQFGAALFDIVKASSRVAMPLIDVFS